MTNRSVELGRESGKVLMKEKSSFVEATVEENDWDIGDIPHSEGDRHVSEEDTLTAKRLELVYLAQQIEERFKKQKEEIERREAALQSKEESLSVDHDETIEGAERLSESPTLQALKNEVNEQRSEIQSLIQSLNEKAQREELLYFEVERLKEKLNGDSELSQEEQLVVAQLDSLKKQRVELEEAQLQMIEQRKKLEKEQAEWEEKRKRKEVLEEFAQVQINVNDAFIDQAHEDEHHTAQAEINHLKKQRAELETAIKVAEVQLDEFEVQLEEYKVQQDKWTAEKANWKIAEEAREDERHLVLSEINHLKEQRAELEETVKNTERQLDKYKVDQENWAAEKASWKVAQ